MPVLRTPGRVRASKGKPSVVPDTYNGPSGRSYYDAYRRRYLPSNQVLVREYKRVAYTCANLNASGVVTTPLRLYLKTDSNSQKTVLREGDDLRPVAKSKIDYLQQQSYLQKTLRSFVNIEEVVRHPILDLLEKANDSPYMNGVLLAELTQLYQEILGRSYLLVTPNILGVPSNLWILPSQYTFPVKESSNSRKLVDFYEFRPPFNAEPRRYRPEDIIPFKFPSLIDPYLDGLSPLAASFEANEVSNKLLSHQNSLLENDARPAAILAPKDADSVWGPDEAELAERKYNQKFGFGRSGGIWVPDQPVELIIPQFNPEDIAKLEIAKWSKVDIANCYDVPYALITDSSHNREQLEAAEVQHAKYGLRKRLNRNACVFNDQLLSKFDDSGRLFLAYDDPVPQSDSEKATTAIQMSQAGLWSPNEGRLYEGTYGKSDVEGMDEPRPINVSPEILEGQDPNKGRNKEDKEDNAPSGD